LLSANCHKSNTRYYNTVDREIRLCGMQRTHCCVSCSTLVKRKRQNVTICVHWPSCFLLASDCSVRNVILIDIQFNLSKQEIKYCLLVCTKPFILLKIIILTAVYQACYNHFGDKLHVGRYLLNSRHQYC
jgi:hypothetical protein